MNMEQITFILVLSVLLAPGIIFGIILTCGKGADLIAGYNTASPAKKAKWNEKALCRATGVLVLPTIGCIITSVSKDRK